MDLKKMDESELKKLHEEISKRPVEKYEPDTTDESLPLTIGTNEKVDYMPGEAMHKAIETVGIAQQFIIRKILPRVNPTIEEHRHVGYDEPHPVDQVHWGEDASDVSIEGPFSVSEFMGGHPRQSIQGYGGPHEHYFKMLQTYLDLANPDKTVTDNQLNVVATNLRPRVMKCADDVRKRYLAHDRELRDIDKLGAGGVDSEELEMKRADAGKVYSVLEDAADDLNHPDDRVQIAMALDKLISLEAGRPRNWYLCELFGISDSEPMREATIRVVDGLNSQKKIELGFAGMHYIVTGNYLLKEDTLVFDTATPMYTGLMDKAFIIEKAEKKKVVIAGYASPVVRDKEGHRIPLYALKKAFAKFMEQPKFRNVMIKHRNAQVAEVVPEYTDNDGKKWISQVDDIGLFVVCILRDDVKIARDVIDLIRKGILRSFSIGGEALGRKYVCENNVCWWDVTNLELHEVTICEEGKNQAAKFILLKCDDVEADSATLDTKGLYLAS
jgi:phage head maturation protease